MEDIIFEKELIQCLETNPSMIPQTVEQTAYINLDIIKVKRHDAAETKPFSVPPWTETALLLSHECDHCCESAVPV